MKAILCTLAAVGGSGLLALSMSAPSASAAAPVAPLASGLCGGAVVGDYDNDGAVGVGDLVSFNDFYNTGSLRADLNKNCIVDVGDIVIMYDYAYASGCSTVIDFNFDGAIDIADSVAYGDAYANGDSRCDMNGDCQVDIADLSVFWSEFLACY